MLCSHSVGGSCPEGVRVLPGSKDVAENEDEG